MTQGRGTFTMQFAQFEDVPAHLVDSLVERHKHDKETAAAH
jgi:translation elongation factor EF-G